MCKHVFRKYKLCVINILAGSDKMLMHHCIKFISILLVMHYEILNAILKDNKIFLICDILKILVILQRIFLHLEWHWRWEVWDLVWILLCLSLNQTRRLCEVFSRGLHQWSLHWRYKRRKSEFTWKVSIIFNYGTLSSSWIVINHNGRFCSIFILKSLRSNNSGYQQQSQELSVQYLSL